VPGWLGLVLAGVIVVSCLALRRRSVPPFFHVLLVAVPVVFIASGSYHDAQSYRYLMPLYAALPVVLAIGIEEMGQWGLWGKLAAASAFAALLTMFAAQEIAWYRGLAPDTRSQAALACFADNGVRGAFADYWLSYKLTFLSGERVIVAPTNGVDRYPSYTAYVRSIGVTEAGQACGLHLLQ
jgi:hypothetical protein